MNIDISIRGGIKDQDKNSVPQSLRRLKMQTSTARLNVKISSGLGSSDLVMGNKDSLTRKEWWVGGTFFSSGCF